ncbi:xanthine dehydrogenase family protein molybdopterin-binding subunit [Pseudoduganella lutea]|uniref:Xanthine dehydrogenase family protein molybdopterin-binding subunit n=2 Tax=Pseudoduganella lutea TaxID=321985 RepID=A0A4P6L7N6_9BURK|nr:xanthine dehydrogenase family protein molybdopterin-binding subunit [Pseudoduganella lutea]
MTPVTIVQPKRRMFLQSAALLGAGLAVGFVLPGAAGAAAGPSAPAAGMLAPNAFVRVFPDDTIRLVVHKHDSGTGTRTALGLVLAEELEVTLEQVEIITPEHPFFKDYMHPQWHVFSTGGSTSVMLEYDTLRKAGASARTMLVQAAAARWQVPVDECHARDGKVIHAATGRQFGYGALATEAARLAPPKEPRLKDKKDFRLIGKLHRKLDAQAKVTGKQTYGIDVKLPGMLVAVILRSPVVGGRVRRFDARKALAVPGVRQVLKVPAAPAGMLGGHQEGVAVLADTYWAAKLGRDALQVQWRNGSFARFDSRDVPALQRAHLARKDGPLVRTIGKGDAARALKSSGRVLRAEYTMPYKVPNPLEPECVVVEIVDGTITYWGGLQVPSNAQFAAAAMAGIGQDKVVLRELVGGGSFGARESRHWLLEATWLAKASGRPVKLMYSREDEVRGLYYHAATYTKVSGALDAEGGLSALKLRAVSPASPEEWEPGYTDRKDRMDYSTTEAICRWDFAYQPDHLDVGWVRHETGMPTGWYRAVSFIPNVFAIESFMDELAHAAGRDPLAFRTGYMKGRPRHVAVLEQAARRAGWDKPRAPGRALGIATNQAYNSYIAIVAELEKVDDVVKVRRITCVADCGLAVHPGSVEEQLYGGLMWGLGHALHDRLDIENGRVVQSNFHDYPVMRMADMPEIDITIVEGDTDKPSGVGELSNPGVAPAIANALFALTGRRQRSTPFDFSAGGDA